MSRNYMINPPLARRVSTKRRTSAVPAHCLNSVSVQDTQVAGDLCYNTADSLHEVLMKNIAAGKLQHADAQAVFQTEQMIRMFADHYWLGGKQ